MTDRECKVMAALSAVTFVGTHIVSTVTCPPPTGPFEAAACAALSVGAIGLCFTFLLGFRRLVREG